MPALFLFYSNVTNCSQNAEKPLIHNGDHLGMSVNCEVEGKRLSVITV